MRGVIYWRFLALALPFAIFALVGAAFSPLIGGAAGAVALLALALVVGWVR
ncbi:hypothetical protein [Ancylobacter sp. IITR112]|uniref:hypothetical protein n=1 Tax=Ancylobacter sp. IITR112 TaxID=3138073 RepID=UPI00352BAE08